MASPLIFSQIAADNFIRANEQPLNPGNWTINTSPDDLQPLTVLNNSCVANSATLEGTEFYTGAIFPSNQYNQVTIQSFGGVGSEIDLYVRADLSLDSGYAGFIAFDSGVYKIFLTDAAANVFLGEFTLAGIPQPGDVFAVTAVGTTISAIYNGLTVLSAPSDTASSGLIGITIQANATQSDTSITGFGAGSVSFPTTTESLDLGAIRSEAQIYLMNTSTDSSSFSWTVPELNGYVNEGVFYTQQVTQWFEEFDNAVSTASVSTYTAPPTAYQMYRLTWDRVFLPQTNEYELDRDDPSWRSAPVNNPFRFYFPQMSQQFDIVPYPTPSQDGFQYAPFSQELGVVANFLGTDGLTADATYQFNQELGIVIGVADTNGAIIIFRPDLVVDPFTKVSQELGELQIYNTDELNIGMAFKRIPDTLVLDTDTPQLPVHCHFGLVAYTVMKAFTREGEFQDLQLAQQWFMVYADWMESVLENKARWWPTRVRSMEPFEEGSLFARALSAIGYPMQLDLKPSYGA